MAKRKSARTIKVPNDVKKTLARLFRCTERMVYKALCFECETELARRIRYVARRDYGGWVEAAVPESEIFYDTVEDGRHLMRQYFGNGAVLEVSLDTGCGVVLFRGEPRVRYDRVMLERIPAIQDLARSMC